MLELKKFELEKGYGPQFAKNFYEHSIVLGMPGLLHFRVLIDEHQSDRDLVVVEIQWDSKESMMNFKKSDIHCESHKNRKPNPKMLSHKTERYQVVGYEAFR